MSLDVLTPAYVTDLVAKAEVKAKYGYDSGDDANLSLYISGACSTLREYLGRELVRQTYLETFYRGGGQELKLSCNPVDPESVSVTINGQAVTDFVLRDAGAGILFRSAGWCCSSTGVAVTYKGGFLIPGTSPAPGLVTTWTAATVYAVGSWVRLTAPSTLRLECMVAGTSHATTAPVMPAAGATVTDGTATWTARHAVELPDTVPSLLAIGVRDLFEGADRVAGLASSENDGASESYFASAGLGGVLSEDFMARFNGLRARYGRL